MANRITLNETSYHGAGAIQEIAGEVKNRGFHKALVCTGREIYSFLPSKLAARSPNINAKFVMHTGISRSISANKSGYAYRRFLRSGERDN